jgi:opacity protein-like surface antigen
MRAVCFALALCALPSAGALAQGMYGSPEDGFYLELAAGYAQFTDNDRDIGGGIEAGVEYGPGFEVRGQAGYKFSYFRAGVELQYAQTNFDALSVAGMGIDADGSPSVWRTTVNGYFDLDNQSRFTPYAGGGLGLAFVSGDEISAGGVTYDLEDETVFTFNVDAGVAIDLNETIALVPAYRYVWLDTGSSEWFDNDTAHIGEVGLRFRF